MGRDDRLVSGELLPKLRGAVESRAPKGAANPAVRVTPRCLVAGAATIASREAAHPDSRAYGTALGS